MNIIRADPLNYMTNKCLRFLHLMTNYISYKDNWVKLLIGHCIIVRNYGLDALLWQHGLGCNALHRASCRHLLIISTHGRLEYSEV